MDYPEMRNTVFGEVLGEFLEARGFPVTPFKVGKLAEEAGLDGWDLIDRMADPDADYVSGLGRLTKRLDLSEPEMMELASAFAYERRAYHPSRARGCRPRPPSQRRRATHAPRFQHAGLAGACGVFPVP